MSKINKTLLEELKEQGEVDTSKKDKKIQVLVSEREKENFDLICKKYNKSKQDLAYEALRRNGLFDKI